MVQRWLILALTLAGMMAAPMLSAAGAGGVPVAVTSAAAEEGCCGEDCACCEAARPAERPDTPACPCNPGAPVAPERAPSPPAMALNMRAGVVARHVTVRPSTTWAAMVAGAASGTASSLTEYLREAPWRPTRAALCIWTT